MIAIIEKLIAQGHAYQAGGEVLFDIQSMPDYGALSRRKLDEQQAGARVAVDAHKKHPHDFVLWKLSSDDEPGWDSPWGRGRPGWHIECSAMSAAYLGNTFDIHGGGLDLIFPHHENEIAQSRCAHGTPVMANVWMHNGFLQVEGEKMSKSLGNFFTIHDLLTLPNVGPRSGDAIRFAMLTTHYRQPIDWTQTKLLEAANNLHTFHGVAVEGLGIDPLSDVSSMSDLIDGSPSEGLIEFLSDDLNTSSAIFSNMFDYARSARSSKGVDRKLARQLLVDCLFLGIDPFRFYRSQVPTAVAEYEIDLLIAARKAARAAKNFAESDRIRDELLAKGIVLKDGPTGTTWEIKR